MLDWWEAAALSAVSVGVGGLIALIAGLVTASHTNRLATERRKGEEEREAKRQHRRKQLEPIFEFLQAAKHFSARAAIEEHLDKSFKEREHDPAAAAAWETLKSESVGDDPDIYQLLRHVFIAATSAPTLEMRQGVVFRVLFAAVKPREKEGESLEDAMIAAQEMIEQYLVAV